MLAPRTASAVLSVLVLATLLTGTATALETAERTLSFEGRVSKGGKVSIDNLLGGIHVVPGTELSSVVITCDDGVMFLSS